ncbi:endothelin-converting enzyme homolog isoform X1 [Ruditapes philippinarum]|uniref:endothelin-converting enzyme homolog isoform X1 n=1 Tax=Ruditapes philippinarum TaxID=129788 RepID=UPI00295B9EA5|nr:endothelin-converting enzyme homolog isoform X1 [Ruditapes philippinarum]
MSHSDSAGIHRGVTTLKFTKTDLSNKTDSAVRFNAAGGGANSGLSFSNPNFGDGSNSTPAAMAENYREFDKSDTSPIIPEIRISTYSFRVREIILGVVSVVAIIGCLVLIALVATNSNSDDTTSSVTSAQKAIRTLCTEASCLKAASYAVSNMNASVNPCDNFHQYACGNYPVLNPLNPDVSQRTIFWNLYYDNEDKLRTILEAPPTRTSSWSSEKKIKDFFMSCIDDYGKMKTGGKTFIDKIITPLGGWDVLNNFNAASFNLQNNLQKTSVDFWTAALFTFRVATDRYDRSNRVIEVDMSGMGMSWAYFIRDTTQQIRDDYKKFMRTVAQLLVADSGLNLDPNIAANKIQTFVDDAFDVEFQLANITANTVPTGDPHNHEKRITLSDLTSQTNNVVDFVSFFQYMFGSSNVNGNTRVILREDDWIRRMLAMVSAIPESDKARKLSNYIVWRLARRYTQELSWNYIHAVRVFWADVYQYESLYGTWYHCFWHADHSMPDALGALYAHQHFNDKNKDKAEEIVRYVKQALIDSVDSNTFMDDTTKQRAKAKLSASTDKMGYPDIYMNDADIDNIYQQISINRTDYFQNLLNLNLFDKQDWTRRLTSGEDRSRWLYNSYDTSMTFYNSWNQLLVPAGILQFPVYEWTLPHYFNFGSMGGLMGHYLVHAIDNWGGSYNENGVYGAWYTNASRTNYRKVETCFSDAYDNKTMGPYKIVGQSAPQSVQVNGRRFAWEGLAETSGIRVAYKAYKKWIADNGEEKPTPTPHYTNDQSFFLAYAQTNCFTRTDALSYYYAQVQRLPEDVRTNTALSLLTEFTQAFNCPAGSKMNAPKKCDTY